MTMSEEVAVMKNDIKYIKETQQEQRTDMKDLTKKFDAFIKAHEEWKINSTQDFDQRYARKDIEKGFIAMIVVIVLAVLGAILKLVLR